MNAEFNLAILEANKEKDILQDGDTIVIPERTNQVYIYGEVLVKEQSYLIKVWI